MEYPNVQHKIVRVEIPYKPIRLPRKLKKDIIKISGREAYWQIIATIYMQVLMGGPQYIKIRKIKE